MFVNPNEVGSLVPIATVIWPAVFALVRWGKIWVESG